jgi:predicted nucleotidyltransferase
MKPMQRLAQDWREFIELLNLHQVKYLVVGGFAVGYHGYPRTTGDIDFFVEVSADNAHRIKSAIDAFGFGSLGLTSEDFQQENRIIQLGYPPNRIDIITSISGVTFAQAWADRIEAELDGIRVMFIGKDTLLVNKAAAGRSKDQADLDALR